jgi:hypothetical protein
VAQAAPQFLLAGAACRQLRVHPRALGRLTGNVWVNDSAGERVDIGLAVKNAKQGLCVPSAWRVEQLQRGCAAARLRTLICGGAAARAADAHT